MKIEEIQNYKIGIYKLLCTANQKYYIGSSNNIKRRIKHEHIYDLRRNQHDTKKLQHTWNKYGEESFEFYIVEECKVDELIQREQFYLDTFKPKLNDTLIAGSPPRLCKKVTLKNYITNDIETCESGVEFAQKFNLLPCQVSAVQNKKTKTAGDWCLPSYTPKQYVLCFKGGPSQAFFSPKQFCINNNLEVGKIQLLLRRKIRVYNGWHLPDIKFEPPQKYIFFKITGEREEIIDLVSFANKYNIKVNRIKDTIKGKQKSCSGWFLEQNYIPKYKLIDLNGNIIEFERINAFAKQHGVSKDLISALWRGKIAQYRGWKKVI